MKPLVLPIAYAAKFRSIISKRNLVITSTNYQLADQHLSRTTDLYQVYDQEMHNILAQKKNIG